MIKQDIKNRTIQIARKIKNYPESYYSDNFTQALTGSVFKYKSQDLIYLFLELQNEFGIHFCEDDVVDYKFNTLSSIVQIIEKYC